MVLAIRRRDYFLGLRGERAVGEELSLLMLDGVRVFHDVPNEPYGNIDHVLVARSGVFGVETKTRRKRVIYGNRKDAEVEYDGKVLRFPFGVESGYLEQAKRQAGQLAQWLSKATGEPVRVSAILTFPGWFVTSRVKRPEVMVLNPRQIGGYLRQVGAMGISEEQWKRICHQLDQRCRDVEL